MSEIVFDIEEINASVRALKPCDRCDSTPGLLVEDPDWEVILLHDPDCTRLVKGHGLKALSGGKGLLSIPGGAA